MIAKTNRLYLRELTLSDDKFIYELVNQKSWLKYIGDKNINNLSDSQKYLLNGPIAMYNQHHFGLWAVEHINDQQVIGICGIIKRDNLPEIDLGFAFLDKYTGYGYAEEACRACLTYAKTQLNKTKILAIAMPENTRSINLLKKLGFIKEEDPNYLIDKNLNMFSYALDN